ncbi:MAG TPA: SDR family NAD(P)-dependent oxidoreductase [Pyrinomonadaceae bacterium]|nr:SDR family NAD(P)-dependent oxidoreductase [Pyrinomonadaceae bacterium]
MNLRGRVALVTGGSRGIGRATVERFAEMGAQVVINYVRDERAAEETRSAAESFGVEALAVRADVAEALEAQQLVSACLERFGRLDFLICNAGVWEGAPVDSMSEEQWEKVIRVNLKGTWAVCRASVTQMKRQGSGRIVIVSSTAGQRGESNYSNYAAAKGGQIAFAKSLATELAASNINVNAVAPGWVLTEMTEGVFRDASRRRSIELEIPLGRVASADDVARPILFLCSDWARHITGEVLNINGGSVLCG